MTKLIVLILSSLLLLRMCQAALGYYHVYYDCGETHGYVMGSYRKVKRGLETLIEEKCTVVDFDKVR